MSFKCPYCDYQSLRSDSILNHLQNVHSNEISEEEINSLIGRKKCPDCGKYVYERYMRKGNSNKKVSDIWERDSLRCQIILEQLNPKYFYIVWESDKDRMMEVITNEVINARTLE